MLAPSTRETIDLVPDDRGFLFVEAPTGCSIVAPVGLEVVAIREP